MQCSSGAAALALAVVVATPVQAQPDPNAASLRLQITPAPEPARRAQKGRATFFTMDVPVATRPAIRGRTMLFGGWQPDERTTIGVGLFSVPKSATRRPDDMRLEPVVDPNGKTSRVAAVGMSFRF